MTTSQTPIRRSVALDHRRLRAVVDWDPIPRLGGFDCADLRPPRSGHGYGVRVGLALVLLVAAITMNGNHMRTRYNLQSD